jgi:dehydrogenase/reductase SDR family protein 12
MRIADLADAALEATLVGSFTRVGPWVRRRLGHWSEAGDLRGRVVVVTGATSGIGLQTARTLAQLGAAVEIVARDAVRAEASSVQIRGEVPGADVGWVQADVGDLDAVRRAAAELRSRRSKLDALVHNAGALDAAYGVSPQGIERTVATHVVGPHLLTRELLPLLRASGSGRVVFVSSGGQYSEALDVGALCMGPEVYDGVVAYARAKRAQVTLAELWAERLAGTGVVVHAMHPGWVDTPGVERSLPRFRWWLGRLLRDPAEGADTVVWLVADDEALQSTGGFWLDRRRRDTHRLGRTRRADTPEERGRLWAWLEGVTAGG